MKRIRTDDQLIQQLLTGESRDKEAAFEAVVKRHGPMVLGICRQILNRHQDAEDAFQTTFLMLARQAARIRNRQVLAHWLYEVAYRIAIRVRAQTARQRPRNVLPELAVSVGGPENAARWRELLPVLRADVDCLTYIQ